MKQLTHGSLFAGIGGFDLGFERAGIKTVWQVEIDPFCRKVLEKHWPNVARFDDIRKFGTFGTLGLGCDVITGGFPCQPISHCGKRKHIEDDRYLWPEMLRVIRAVRPAFVVAENVSNLAHGLDWILEQVCDDLEASGYETIPPLMVPACAFGAWHQRDRVWIIAHITQDGCEGGRVSILPGRSRQAGTNANWRGSAASDTSGIGLERPELHRGNNSAQSQAISEGSTPAGNARQVGTLWDSEPALERMVHGVSAGMVRNQLESLGNAVVPQIAEWIGLRIVACYEGEKGNG